MLKIKLRRKLAIIPATLFVNINFLIIEEFVELHFMKQYSGTDILLNFKIK